MSRGRDYVTAKALGIWRSRTLRLAVYAAIAWLVVPAGAVYAVADYFRQVDPILVQSGAFKMVFALVYVVLAMEVLKAFDNYAGIRFREDVLTELKDRNLAVALYFGLRLIAVFLGMAWALG